MPQPLTGMFPQRDASELRLPTITRPAYYVFWWPHEKADQQLQNAIERLPDVKAVSPSGEGYNVHLKNTSLPVAEKVRTKLIDFLKDCGRNNDRVIVRL